MYLNTYKTFNYLLKYFNRHLEVAKPQTPITKRSLLTCNPIILINDKGQN